MYQVLLSAPRFLFFTLIVFSTSASAQWIEPDKQVVREMLAYLGKIEASSASREAASGASKTNSATNAAARQSSPNKETPRVSSAVLALERRAFDILNEQRGNHGLAPLKWSEDMAQVARLHSENMARDKFFSHRGKDGSMVSDRAKRMFTRTWYSIGENIAFNQGFNRPVEMACQQWLSSPGHRENILDPQWTESGIGAAFAPDGTFYLTQVFIN